MTALASDSCIAGLEISIVIPCYNEYGNVEPLVRAIDQALRGRRWEIIFVDDSSPDGTIGKVRELAQKDSRVRGIERIGRRGLSSAVIEGVLSSSAECIAVMDGDMQHEEARLPDLLDAVLKGNYDFAVGSRHVPGGNNTGLANYWRRILSNGGIWLSRHFLPVILKDPMSGFFVMKREHFVQLVPKLSGTGFKILLDLVMSASKPVNLLEIPCHFRSRLSGESKLDVRVMIQFLGMLIEKFFQGYFPINFITNFLWVILGGGLTTVIAYLVKQFGLEFTVCQWIGSFIAFIGYIWVIRLFSDLGNKFRAKLFCRYGFLFLLAFLGMAINIWLANMMYMRIPVAYTTASLIGGGIGMLWNNFIVSSLLWRS